MDRTVLETQLAAVQAAITASAPAKSTAFGDRRVDRHNLDALLEAQRILQDQLDAMDARAAGRMTIMTAKWTA